jgi:pyruvate/2-oxoglutarate dehydrogenase complex dihydrolipoamide acyltransferase (E2) component
VQTSIDKIQQGDGAKAIQVGTRIAVTAEPGDDLSTLEIPPENDAATKPTADGKATPNEAPKETEPVPKQERKIPSQAEEASPPAAKKMASGEAKKQTYPLYPSVQHLLKENGLPREEADKIPATGPNGRLLKGDVLAYLGRINESYSKDQSERIAKLAHLDLSDIKMKMPAPAQAPPKPAPPEIPPVVEEPEVQVSLPISFEAVMECQRRVKKSIGVLLPSSTFIARAAELANEELPRSKTAKPSADELFNAVLGLDKVTGKKYSRGNFIPQISGLSSAPKGRMPARAAKSDILDILSGKKPTHRPSKALGSADSAMAPVVSVSVPKGDERRGQVFLERFKSALELEPGRLVV